jgi:hypothetical protein
MNNPNQRQDRERQEQSTRVNSPLGGGKAGWQGDDQGGEEAVDRAHDDPTRSKTGTQGAGRQREEDAGKTHDTTADPDRKRM